MSILAALRGRAKSVPARVAVAAALALTLAGCATGPGAGTEPDSTSATSTTAVETTAAEPTAAPDDGRIEANVIVLGANYDAAAGTIEVSSIVTNHIGEGTCIIAATSAAGESLETEVAALPDAQSTVCPTTVLDGAAEGEWTVTVTFDSDEAYGESEATPAEVL